MSTPELSHYFPIINLHIIFSRPRSAGVRSLYRERTFATCISLPLHERENDSIFNASSPPPQCGRAENRSGL